MPAHLPVGPPGASTCAVTPAAIDVSTVTAPLQKEPRKRRRTSTYRPPDMLGGPRDNGRVLLLENPCLALRFLPSGALAMVEKPWADVLLTLPAPLHRKTFGE